MQVDAEVFWKWANEISKKLADKDGIEHKV